MLNFFDKLVLGLAAVPMMRDLSISPAKFGYIGSSFFLLYAVSGIVTGLFLIGRVKVKWILAGLAILWSVSQLAVFFTNSFMMIVAGRILLGVGEGPALPTALHACYDWFDGNRRSVPAGFILQGISFGFLAGSPLLTAIIVHRGWHTAFLVCGLLSIGWIALWLILGAEGPFAAENELRASADRSSALRMTHRELWLNPTVIGVMVMSTMSYWVVGMAGTWLPPYLRQGLGYGPSQTGWIISAVYLFQSPLLLVGAWFTQRLLRRGYSRRICLGHSSAAVLLMSAVALAAATRSQGVLQLCLIAVGFAAPSLTTVFGPLALAGVAPPAQRGKLIVVIYSANTISALVSNAAVGWLVGRAAGHVAAGYSSAMLLTASVQLTGALAAFLLMFPRRFPLTSNPVTEGAAG